VSDISTPDLIHGPQEPQADPYQSRREDLWMYERTTPTILNTTLSANTTQTLRLPSTAPTRIVAVQVTVRLEVLTGTGRLLFSFVDPQGATIWSIAGMNGIGPTQDTCLLPPFRGGLPIATTNTFGGAFTVGTIIFVSGYLRGGG
jgi:hypothetical protein